LTNVIFKIHGNLISPNGGSIMGERTKCAK
jgi:hypothetical protein